MRGVRWGGRIKEREGMKGGKEKQKWKGWCAWGERRENQNMREKK